MSEIDQDQDPQDMTESAVLAEFTELTNLQQHPGFVRYHNTLTAEYNKILDTLFLDEATVKDVASFFLREETINTGKVLRRYLSLVDDRIKELKDQIETNKRDRTQQT